MCRYLSYWLRYDTKKNWMHNDGTFCPSLHFGTILSNLPAYNWLYNVIWPSKPGYISNIGERRIIFGNGGTFYPGLPFTPSRFFANKFIFVLVPKNLIMSGVRRDSILSPLWETSHRLWQRWWQANKICVWFVLFLVEDVVMVSQTGQFISTPDWTLTPRPHGNITSVKQLTRHAYKKMVQCWPSIADYFMHSLSNLHRYK